MTEQARELLPCPFCGGLMTNDKFGFDHPKGSGKDDDCLLSFASFPLSQVEAWNTRASQQQARDNVLVDALRAADTAFNTVAANGRGDIEVSIADAMIIVGARQKIREALSAHEALIKSPSLLVEGEDNVRS